MVVRYSHFATLDFETLLSAVGDVPDRSNYESSIEMTKSIFRDHSLSLPVTEEVGKLCATIEVLKTFRPELIEHVVNFRLSKHQDISNLVGLLFMWEGELAFALMEATIHPDTTVSALRVTNECELGAVAAIARIREYETTAGALEAGYFFNASGNKERLGKYQIAPIALEYFRSRHAPQNAKFLKVA